MFRSSKEIADEIKALQAKVEGILAVAKEDGRDLNDEEKTEVDSIVGTDSQPGIIANLREDLSRKQRMEAHVSSVVKGIEDKQDSASNRIKVPARAKHGSSLKAFKTEEDAYAMGQWALATLGGNRRAKAWCRDHGIKNVMTTGDNTLGGFLVPEPLANSIIEQREQYGVARAECTVLQMGDAVMNVPRLNTEVTSFYVGENSTITASDPVLNQIKLEAKKLAALTVISSEMSEDSVIGVAEMLSRSIAQSFAIAEDSALFLGDGTSTYGGIVGLAAAINAGSVVTASSRQTFGALTFADFEGMVGLAKQWRGANFKWYVSQVGWANSMQRLADAAGGNNVMTLAEGASRFTFMGYPVVISQVLESRTTGTTTARALYFGDLRGGCYMGVKRDIQVQADSSRYFENDAIAIRATERFDINVFDRGTASVSGGIVALNFG
jgi:HK97 family phage major capsid protein